MELALPDNVEVIETDPSVVPPVPSAPFQQQLKGQLRIGISALGGALVLPHVLPIWLVNDPVVGFFIGLSMLGAAAVWQWARARVIHSRFWRLAIDHRVPDDLVRPAVVTIVS